MKTVVLNYRVIIEPDTETGTNKAGFTAYCPTLGIADDGDTIEEALENIQRMIPFHLESLQAEGQSIPHADNESALLTNIKISWSAQSKIKYA